MRRLAVVLMLCVAVLAACSKPPQQQGGGAKEGQAAPEITVTDLAGQRLSLSSLRGKVVMLNFFGTFCRPCREEMPSMMRLNQAMDGQPFQMLVVSIADDREGLTAYARDNHLQLPFYLDQDGVAAKSYGTYRIPETYLIGKDGVVLKKVIGGLQWDAPEVVDFLRQAAAR